MNFNKQQFVQDAYKEYCRWSQFKKEAHYNGKRSKAKLNTNKFSKKYNLSTKGHGFLDMFFGHIIMQTFGDAFNTSEEYLLPRIEKSFEMNEYLLNDELKLVS